MKQPDASIVRITDPQGETHGTGFIISADGRVVIWRRSAVWRKNEKPYV